MELTFYGAAGIVTGSCYLLKAGNKNVLVDCGEFQDKKEITKLNFERFDFNPKEISAVLLTHAHNDHCGLLPKLYNHGFRGPIFSTNATKDLCEIMLLDAAHIHIQETEKDNERLRQQGLQLRKPLFTIDDVKNVMKLFKGIYYNHLLEITSGIKATFRDAGHILGSAMIEVFATEDQVTKKIVFSGDIGQADSPIVKDPTIIRDADYVLIESTYGSRNHEDVKQRKEMLFELVKETEENKGYLIIPCFALERTQEILYVMNEFSNADLLKKINIYVDSPLAEKATGVYLKHTECYDDETMRLLAQDSNPFMFDELKFTTTKEQSKELNKKEGPIVIMSGSGMCTGGRIKHHLTHHLPDKNATVLFVGYQAVGSLGRKIRDGESPVKIYNDDVEVNANVVSIGGFSSHADQSGLVAWAKNFLPKTPIFFIVHGEPEESEGLKKKLNVLGFKTIIPNLFDSYKL